MTKRVFFFLPLLTLGLIACAESEVEEPSFDGVWQSIGYGRILHIQGDDYSMYDITRISCLPARQAKVSEFGEAIRLSNDTLSITVGTVTHYYTAAVELPELCTRPLSEEQRSDPIYNFEVLAQTIQEHYVFFELNNINWDSLYTIQKSKLNANSSDAELYLILEELLRLLNDNHGYIEPTDEVYEQAEQLRPSVEEADNRKEYGDFEIAQMVADHYLVEDLTEDSWLIHWGKTKDNGGYLQVKAMWLFADLNLSNSLVKKNGFVDTYVDAFTRLNEGAYIQEEVKGVRRIMKKVMDSLSDTDYLIIDIRFNGGGQDAVSLEILRHFNDKPVRVVTQKVRFGDDFSPVHPIVLDASSEPYQQAVFILTSQQTASAADIFAFASLSLEHARRIGSPTQGALSTALEKKLPNGWYFAISNELCVDKAGVFYENVGIPVDVDLGYPEGRQDFFRWVADNLQEDKANVFEAINSFSEKID